MSSKHGLLHKVEPSKEETLNKLHVHCHQQPSNKAILQPRGRLHLNPEDRRVVFITLPIGTHVPTLNILGKGSLSLLTPYFLSLSLSLQENCVILRAYIPYKIYARLPSELGSVCLTISKFLFKWTLMLFQERLHPSPHEI